MTINQLFKKSPTMEIINELLLAFGLTGLNDNKMFSRKDLDNMDTIGKLNNIIDRLGNYYLPCKRKIYLTNLTPKKSITILRQCIKIYKYILFSKEKYIKSEKIIVYQIIPMDKKLVEKKIKNGGGCVISFD